jgi:hypothetical protein
LGAPEGDFAASCAILDGLTDGTGRATSFLGIRAGNPARGSSAGEGATGLPVRADSGIVPVGSATTGFAAAGAPARGGAGGTNAAFGPSRSGGSAGWPAAPFPSATNVLSSSSSLCSDSPAPVALVAPVAAGLAAGLAAAGLTLTGPLSVMGIGTFAARGISGIASGGMLPGTYAGGCVITVRRVASFGPPAAGTTMGMLCLFERTGWAPALGDVRPIRVFTGPFAPFASAFELAPAADGGEEGEDLTLVTDESSSMGLALVAPSGFPLPTSSGMVAAGTHSGIPGRHTSVDGGRTLLASAERSSSVRTSR